MLRTFFSRVTETLRSRRPAEQFEHDLDDELRSHLDLLTERFVSQGMSPQDARRAARLQFGGTTSMKESLREQRELFWLNNVGQDVRYALRRLRRDWLFTASAALILAVGLGANTAVFSVVNAVVYRSQSFPQPDALVNVYQNIGEQRVPTGVSFPAFRDIARQTNIFEDTAAVLSRGISVYQLPNGSLIPGRTEFATSNYLRTLNLAPVRGRWFNAEEDGPAAAPVAVIGYRTWTEQFHADPTILGRTIRFGQARATVIGVAPPEFHSSTNPSIFTTFWLSISALPAITGSAADSLERRDSLAFLVKARLRDGVTIEQAQAVVDTLVERLKTDHQTTDPGAADPGRGMTVLRARDVRFGPQIDTLVKPAAFVALIIVGLILAIACGNLATLLLVRGSARAHEIAVRIALGATRWQLVRGLLAESVVLTVVGAAAGWLLAEWGVRILRANVLVDFRLDFRALVYLTALSLVIGIGSGLGPALASTKAGLASGRRDQGGTWITHSHRWLTLKNGLIVGQVSASFLLLIVTGFGVRLIASARQDPGFQVAGLSFLQTDARFTGYDRTRAIAVMQEFVRRVEAIPGVEHVFAINGQSVPPSGSSDARVQIEGRESSPSLNAPNSGFDTLVGWGAPGFVDTLRIPLLYGRDFNVNDRPATPRVAIINATMAQGYFGGMNAVGKRFRYVESRQNGFSGLAEVIGVVGDTHDAQSVGFVQPLFYLSSVQSGSAPGTIVARSLLHSPDAAAQLAQRMRAELRALDPTLFVLRSDSIQSYRDAQIKPWTDGIAMLGGLATLGLGLACLGLYAVVAFAVTRRTQEVGIRMALGARRAQVVWLMMFDVTVLICVGLAIGVGVSVAALAVTGAFTPSTTTLVVPRPVTDPRNFLVITAIMAAVGLLAAYFPARRAAQGDPLAALRNI
jgi:predicted permease